MVNIALVFIMAVLPIAQEYGCSITSYFRTPQRNELVGGVPDSKHLKAEAIDCVLDADSYHPSGASEFFSRLEDFGFEVIIYPTHIHIETRN